MKSTKPDTIISLQQKIKKLDMQIDGMKVKLLKLEIKSKKQEQEIATLRGENLNLKKEITLPSNIMKTIAAIKGLEHNKPPK